MSIATAQVSGLILAGGRATRMGGADKGWLPFHGEPLIRHQVRRLQAQVGPLMINANRHLEDYRRLGLPVLPDLQPGFAGPLAGMQAGLSHCTTDYLATVPCDSPLFPVDLVARLADALLAQSADAAIAVTGSGTTVQRHPVFCLLRHTLLQQLTDALARGERRVDAWLASVGAVAVRFDQPEAFVNLNTPAELEALQRRTPDS